MKMMQWFRRWVGPIVHIGSLLPLALLILDGLTGSLTVNPIQDLTLRTGKAALVLLVLSLACTPLSLFFGWKWVLRQRKPLGLYAFLYVGLHLLVFAVLDFNLDLALIGQAVVEKRYVLVGFASFVLLVPLAITSTKGWMRRLGQNWKRLHRLVYPAAGLAVLHYIWLVKSDIREPLLYGAALVLLLLVRLPAVRHWLAGLAAARVGRAQRNPDAESETDQHAQYTEHRRGSIDDRRST
jgi:sulfoxide reductase heme-binding subunit YedZ